MAKVPTQRKGASSDVQHTVRCRNEDEAITVYERGRKNLLDINRWQSIAGKLSADFSLTDAVGVPVQRPPQQGDYIRIHLPSSTQGTYDWVRIEALDEAKKQPHIQCINMRVRPTDPPNAVDETTHFFSSEATSTFSVARKGSVVVASVRGRNEVPNTEAVGVLQKVRNALVALAAMVGFNKPQWKGLVKGFLKY